MKPRALVILLVATWAPACASTPPPPPRESAASGLEACKELPAQNAAVAADEHVITFEVRSELALKSMCFNSGGHRVAGESKGGATVFPLHIKKSLVMVKYHLHASSDAGDLAYNNEIRPSKHADDVVKVAITRSRMSTDGHLDATQSR